MYIILYKTPGEDAADGQLPRLLREPRGEVVLIIITIIIMIIIMIKITTTITHTHTLIYYNVQYNKLYYNII